MGEDSFVPSTAQCHPGRQYPAEDGPRKKLNTTLTSTNTTNLLRNPQVRAARLLQVRANLPPVNQWANSEGYPCCIFLAELWP